MRPRLYCSSSTGAPSGLSTLAVTVHVLRTPRLNTMIVASFQVTPLTLGPTWTRRLAHALVTSTSTVTHPTAGPMIAARVWCGLGACMLPTPYSALRTPHSSLRRHRMTPGPRFRRPRRPRHAKACRASGARRGEAVTCCTAYMMHTTIPPCLGWSGAPCATGRYRRSLEHAGPSRVWSCGRCPPPRGEDPERVHACGAPLTPTWRRLHVVR